MTTSVISEPKPCDVPLPGSPVPFVENRSETGQPSLALGFRKRYFVERAHLAEYTSCGVNGCVAKLCLGYWQLKSQRIGTWVCVLSGGMCCPGRVRGDGRVRSRVLLHGVVVMKMGLVISTETDSGGRVCLCSFGLMAKNGLSRVCY